MSSKWIIDDLSLWCPFVVTTHEGKINWMFIAIIVLNLCWHSYNINPYICLQISKKNKREIDIK